MCIFEILRIRSFNFNFRYMASHMYIPDINVHVTCNAVTLVWGSLRLAPIIRTGHFAQAVHLTSESLVSFPVNALAPGALYPALDVL